MCLSSPKPVAPPPPPAPPPVLEQAAPKSAANGTSTTSRNRAGLSKYKIDGNRATASKLGGIPTKTGAGA